MDYDVRDVSMSIKGINFMSNDARARARRQFEAIQKKKSKQAQSEQEEERARRAEHAAGLRALRLAKEAADEKAEELEDSSSLPVAHRTSP